MRFDPGPGMGGHCLPVDPFYLAYKAREHDFYTEFIELAGKINQNQPHFCVRRIERALNDVGKPTKGAQGPAARRLLQGRRRRHPRVPGAEDHPAARRARRATSPTTTPTCPSCPTSSSTSAALDEALAAADLVCIVTAHPTIDYQRVVADASLVLDFRGVTRGIEASNLVRL